MTFFSCFYRHVSVTITAQSPTIARRSGLDRNTSSCFFNRGNTYGTSRPSGSARNRGFRGNRPPRPDVCPGISQPRASLLRQARTTRRAAADLSRAIELEPTTRCRFMPVASARYSLRDFARAIGDYSEAIRIDPITRSPMAIVRAPIEVSAISTKPSLISIGRSRLIRATPTTLAPAAPSTSIDRHTP